MRIEIKQRIEQIRRGEVPDGYKKTLLGVAPKEWTISRIDKICRLSSGSTPRRDNSDNFRGDILWITSGELKNKVISDTNEKINEGAAKSSHLEMYDQGTVVIAIYGLEAEGVRGTASIIAKKSTISQACMAFTNFQNVYNEYFYYWYIKNGQVIGLRYAQGTKQQNLSSEIIGSFPFCFPKEEEQRKIVAILATQDKVIELYEKKIEQLQLLKKVCLQKMFPKQGRNVPEVRFPGFTEPWEQRKLGDITYPAGVKNKDNLPLESYSITNEHGFIPQDEQFENGGTMREADKRMYYIVSPNSFAYNPARINVGSIGYLDINKKVIISSLYEVFKTTNEIDDRLLWHWVKSPDFNRLIKQLQEGGVRQYFYYDKFCMGNLYLPSIDEQHKIGVFFDTLDDLITLHQRKYDEEKRKKKSLMQLLLTGIVRVEK